MLSFTGQALRTSFFLFSCFVWTLMKHEVIGNQGLSHRGNDSCEAILCQTLVCLKTGEFVTSGYLL